ncbi:MAG: hypothetical protein C0596_11190 [Marinilabiliales bacterium]|nr:MAG: hypothetical protein C0596_11190 [Marinilabiliales bacterium]
MKLFNLKNIAEKLKFDFIGNPDNEFSKLLIDSRKIVPYHLSLFFAFEGKQHDGHIFIEELYTKGVRCFVVSRNIDYNIFPEASFIKVESTLEALQKIASLKRKDFTNPVIAITGSNGKTIVKEWLYHILSVKKNISRSPKSYNSQLGVPLSIWIINNQSDLAIIEAGISKPGEMDRLEKIINPDIGILTNIGSAHQSNFKDKNEKLLEKLNLFKNCNTVISNHEYLDSIKNKRIITWSFDNHDADIYCIENIVNDYKSIIKLKFLNKEYELKIPFTDFGSISNAIICFSYLTLSGDIDNKEVISRFESLPGVQMRLETLDAINNSILINDSYNSDINSLEIALDYLIQKKGNKRTFLIMSDILQNSSDSKKFYSEIANLIKDKQIDSFIGIGKNLVKYKNLFKTKADFYLSTKDYIDNLKYKDFISCAILLKGAREFKFEEISKRLQFKTHESYLETDMNLMRENLLYFKSLLKPKTKIMAIVKAFSYGSGYREIAAFLQHNRIDYLAVAYTDEGVELRNDGIKTPIMVMNPSARDFNKMLEFKLEP